MNFLVHYQHLLSLLDGKTTKSNSPNAPALRPLGDDLAAVGPDDLLEGGPVVADDAVQLDRRAGLVVLLADHAALLVHQVHGGNWNKKNPVENLDVVSFAF